MTSSETRGLRDIIMKSLDQASEALKALRLTRRYFGNRVMMRYLVNLPSAVREDALVSAFHKVGTCEMKYRDLTLRFRVANPLFVWEIIEKGCYSGREGFAIQPDWTVVDAGANVGVFSLYAASLARRGKVISLEPNLVLFNFLSENVHENGFSNVICVNAALRHVDGSTYFGGIPSGGSIMADYARKVEAVTVDCHSVQGLIDTFGLQTIDLLKMDIEGAEFDVFQETGFLSRVSRIAMEVHPKYGDIHNIKLILEKAGFEVDVQTAFLSSELSYLYALKPAGDLR